MVKFITNEQIEEIKRMKPTIDYSKLNELKKILEANGKKLSVNNFENSNNIYDIYFKKHENSIENEKICREYRKNNPAVSVGNWSIYLFNSFFDQVDPEGFRIFKFAKETIFDKNSIESKLKEFNIIDFDVESFILNKDFDFDFNPYTNGLDKYSSNQIKNVTTLSLNVHDFFDSVTKGLDDQTKEECKNNFIGKIDYILKNVSREDIIKKQTKFLDLLSYLNK